MGETVTFSAGERSSTGYLALPEGGEGPAVLVLHAWWGLTDFFKQVCDRLAGAGFVALAPDLYHGETAATLDDAERLSHLDHPTARQEVAAAIAYLGSLPAVTRPTMGAIGFSLGSSFALTLQEPVKAIVTFYGLTYPDRVAGDAAFLGHFAENDEYESPEIMRELEARLKSLGRETAFYTYPGTRHWFFEEDRPASYNPEAARLAWDRTIAFLNSFLQPN